MRRSKKQIGFVFSSDVGYDSKNVTEYLEKKGIPYKVREEGIIFQYSLLKDMDIIGEMLRLKHPGLALSGFTSLKQQTIEEADNYISQLRAHYDQEILEIIRLLDPAKRTKDALFNRFKSTFIATFSNGKLVDKLYSTDGTLSDILSARELLTKKA